MSEEELRISLDEFREKFCDSNGAPEYDSLCDTTSEDRIADPLPSVAVPE